jgi:hypothetical protein
MSFRDIELAHRRGTQLEIVICRVISALSTVSPKKARVSPVRRTVGGISDKPLWLEAEALFGPLDHGHCRVDLGLEETGAITVNGDPRPDMPE